MTKEELQELAHRWTHSEAGRDSYRRAHARTGHRSEPFAFLPEMLADFALAVSSQAPAPQKWALQAAEAILDGKYRKDVSRQEAIAELIERAQPSGDSPAPFIPDCDALRKAGPDVCEEDVRIFHRILEKAGIPQPSGDSTQPE